MVFDLWLRMGRLSNANPRSIPSRRILIALIPHYFDPWSTSQLCFLPLWLVLYGNAAPRTHASQKRSRQDRAIVDNCTNVLIDLGLLLGGSGLCLGSLLLVAADHDDGQERADDGRTEENEDNRDSDSPDAGEEEVLERVVIVDKGLYAQG